MSPVSRSKIKHQILQAKHQHNSLSQFLFGTTGDVHFFFGAIRCQQFHHQFLAHTQLVFSCSILPVALIFVVVIIASKKHVPISALNHSLPGIDERKITFEYHRDVHLSVINGDLHRHDCGLVTPAKPVLFRINRRGKLNGKFSKNSAVEIFIRAMCKAIPGLS